METTPFSLLKKKVQVRTYIVSEAQIELLQDEQVSAEQRPGHGHVTDGLTDHRHGGAAAVQLRQADPGAQTCRTQRSVIMLTTAAWVWSIWS